MGFGGVVLAVLVAHATPVHAEPTPAQQASAVAAAGAKLYAATDYMRAAARFDDAYALDPLPQYLFNAAQSYRLANSCELAADRYAKFLDAAHDAQNVDKVRSDLDDMRACAAKEHPAPPPTPVTPPPPPVTPPPAPPPTPVMAPAHPTPPPDDVRGQHRTERIAGIVVGGLGVALFGFGAYETGDLFYVKGKQDDCNKTPSSCSVSTFAGYDRDGHRANTWSPLGLGVGGAAIVGGTLLWMIGRDPERAQLGVTSGGAVLSTTVRF
jgi:hypothetical protein